MCSPPCLVNVAAQRSGRRPWHPAGVDCAGLLLTGGASTRMGRDKATIVVDGMTLAARTARLLAAVASPCIEVGPGRSGLRAVEEEPRGGGPLVAVAAGVTALPTNGPALVVACDLPRLSEALLQWLADHPAPGSVVPLWGGRPQPLCARWSGPALARAVELAGTGARSMNALLDGSDALVVMPPARLAAALVDVDTPDQLDEVGGIDST
jgi:molybdopterin-guanine dinucleotide biosynthesis protein A